MNGDPNSDFLDGVWFAIQYLVVHCDNPTIAKEIAMDANIDRRRAMVLQTVSAYEDTKMIKFIMNEL